MERGGDRQTDKDKKVERDRTEKAGEGVTRKTRKQILRGPSKERKKQETLS